MTGERADHVPVTSRRSVAWWVVVGVSAAALTAVSYGVTSGGGDGVTGAPRAVDAASQLRDRLSVFDRPATEFDMVYRTFQESLDTLPGPQETRRAAKIEAGQWYLSIRGGYLCVIHVQSKMSGGSSCSTAAVVLRDQYMFLINSIDDGSHAVIGIALLDGCRLSDANTEQLWQQDNLAVFAADPSPQGFEATLQCSGAPDVALAIGTHLR